MKNQSNNNLSNHTSGKIFRSPCSSSGLHNLSLDWQDTWYKSHQAVPNSTFCNDCHQKDRLQRICMRGRSNGILWSLQVMIPISTRNKILLPNGAYGGVTDTGCGNCHDFVLPLLPSGFQFSTANCTSCHFGMAYKSFAEAPRFPPPLTAPQLNPSSRRIWNGSSPVLLGHNTVNACKYCHGEDSFMRQIPGNVSASNPGKPKN